MSKANTKQRTRHKKHKRGTDGVPVETAETPYIKKTMHAETEQNESGSLNDWNEESCTGITVEDSEFVPYDDTLLDVCRSRWQFADWQNLASIDSGLLRHHPQRGKIALLISAAHWQLGQVHEANRFMQMALDSDVSQRQAVQILISGVHQSLAVANSILCRNEDSQQHFLEATRSSGVPGDAELLAKARMERM